MRNLIAFIVCFLMFSMGSYAMIQTLSLEELASGAELIVIGKTISVKTGKKTPEGFTIIENLIEVQKGFKGKISNGEQIKILTYENMEDSIEFVEGKKFLLFLTKYENQYIVFNSPQGGWPINADGSFAGMGTDITLEQVRAAIK